jgi:dTDP-4-keto-6-deoxy-L-hexose 4-reductase
MGVGFPDPAGPLVVVLGASGFIGSAVVSELTRRSVRVRAVSRDQGFSLAGVEFTRVDLADKGAVGRVVADADAVIHLAAHIGGEKSWRSADVSAARVNVGLMRDLVHAVQDHAPVVFASTLQAEYLHGRSAGEYVTQKVAAEEIMRNGLPRGIALRLPTVYGQSPLSGSLGRGVIWALALMAVAGDPITMWHDGSVERDLLHVTDAARAFTAALTCADDLAGRPWAIGTGLQRRLGDVFSTLAGIVADRTGHPPVPVVTVPPPDYAESHDLESAAVDCSAFPAVTGWQPQVALPAGLADVVDAITRP